MQNENLTFKIIGCAFKVHNALGAGFLEKVYENALRMELVDAGLKVQQQVPIHVRYRGQIVGEYFADLFVEDHVIVEIKAVRKLAPEHEVQLVHYLTATGLEIGLLINFGTSVEYKRKHKTYLLKNQSSANDDSAAP
ncbi:MAG: GxxExxY protein [Anaerolineae bacterium]|nr:GxxExxY protein [Anaerolineae bacterium]MCB0202164.1 GxxExxY protein [Anaerolineae bacterium]